MGLIRSIRLVAPFLFLSSAILHAVPMLRLASTTVGPVSIAVGAAGGIQTVEAYNAGDGSLTLTATPTDPATGKAVTWLAASLQTPRACATTTLGKTCIPIALSLNTAGLAAGSTTAIVTVSDPNAVDAPQTITVTVQMGSSIPNSATAYVAPNSSSSSSNSVDIPIATNSMLRSSSTTQDRNDWLSLGLVSNGQGSFTFVFPYTIHLAPLPANVAGAYNGSLNISGSSFAGDNKTVAVTMNVTTQPIAQASSQVLNVRLAQSAKPYVTGVAVSNLGVGALTVQSVTASGGSWLSATQSGNAASITLDPGSLTPGLYSGSIAIASNAVNTLPPIPVNFQVLATGPPYIPFQGVVDGATFTSGDPVSPGDIVTIFGEQLSYAAPSAGGAPPLPATLNTTQVLVNGQPAPLYYNSYSQINFQMPATVSAGTALVNVVRDGQMGNAVSVGIANRAPRLLLYSAGFGAIVNADACGGISPCNLGGSLPFTANLSQPGYPAYPAKVGDTLELYAIGLGATSPSVATGQPAPASTLAMLTTTPTVRFGNNLFSPTVTPDFAGLSPGFAGLYQVNVRIPANAPKGVVGISLVFPDSSSNEVLIAIQ